MTQQLNWSQYQVSTGVGAVAVCLGANNNAWITDTGFIHQVTAAGSVANYATAASVNLSAPCLGSDGNVWFGMASATASVVKITTSGVQTVYSVGSNALQPGNYICSGSDNRIWWTVTSGSVVAITTTGTKTVYSLPGANSLWGICSGPDNNLWISDQTAGSVGVWKVTTSGVTTRYPLPSNARPGAICVGPDNNLWCLDPPNSVVWKITTSGVMTPFVIPPLAVGYSICNADNALWFVGESNLCIYRMTTGGDVTTYPVPSTYANSAAPWWICAAQGTALWVSYALTYNLPSGLYYVAPLFTGTQAYYRCGDNVGSSSIQDSSGNANTGSLIAGQQGLPAFGATGPFLYDANTALDLTNGTNLFNGGFQTVDNTTQPPTVYQPLGSASVWSFETWMKYTSTATKGTTYTFSGNINNLSTVISNVSSAANLAVGDLVIGPNIPAQTYITSINSERDPTLDYISISNPASGTATSVVFTAVPNAVGQTLFSGITTSGQVDVRVGTLTTTTNCVMAGPVSGGYITPSLYTINAADADDVLDKNWHHVVATYAASVATLYVDGVFSASVITPSVWTYPTAVTIGCDFINGTPTNGFVGTVSDVALYKIALTPTQVANHYQTGMWFQQQEYGASVGGTTAGRFNKALAVAGLNPAVLLSVPYQFRTLMYAETNVVTTTSVLNYLQTLSETEPGVIFQGPNGYLYAYNRQYQYLNPTTTTSQAVFADTPSSTYHYEGQLLEITGDDLDTWNDVQVQSGRSGSQLQEWGPVQSSVATQSAATYGSRTLQGLTSLQHAYDIDALSLAQNYLAWYNAPINRVTGMGISAQSNGGSNIPQMLGRGLMDRITITYNGQTAGTPFSQDSLIEQITHKVSMNSGPTWVTEWAMSPYEILLYPVYLGVWTFGSPASSGVLTL